MKNKDAYEKKMQAQMKERSAEIEKLQAKAEQAEADASIDADSAIRELKDKKAAAEAKLDELRETSDDAWNDVKRGFDAATSALSASLKSASARFSS